MRFKLLPLGLTFGVVWGLAVAGMALVAAAADYGRLFVDVMASVYPYYEPGIGGAVAGLVCGFADGFSAGVIMWLALNWSVAKAGE